MNRRGFIAAILAAPLAVVGNFAGSHNLVIGSLTGPDAFAFKTFAKFKGPTALWTNLCGGWTYIEFGDGRIIRSEKWHGKNPLFHAVAPPPKILRGQT